MKFFYFLNFLKRIFLFNIAPINLYALSEHECKRFNLVLKRKSVNFFLEINRFKNELFKKT